MQEAASEDVPRRQTYPQDATPGTARRATSSTSEHALPASTNSDEEDLMLPIKAVRHPQQRR